ncbi:predicted protein, partial [Nematostella vectensis]
MTHAAYKGEAPMIQELIGGQLQMCFSSALNTKPFIDSGKLKAIGVTGKERMEILPKLPTIHEQGVTDDAYAIYGWVAMGAPAGVPKEIVDQLYGHLREIAKDPKVLERTVGAGFMPLMNSPQAFRENYQRDMPIWKALTALRGDFMYTRNPASPARPTRRSVLALAAAPLLAGMAGGALAETGWPSKMLRLVVPFPAGGPTDTASRIVGQKLGERLKQTVVVENRPGASGSIAAVQVAKSPADGYTLMMLATPTLLAPHLYKKAGYDTVKDFTPVATVYDLPIVIVVNPTLLPDVTDLKSLIAHAKAQK